MKNVKPIWAVGGIAVIGLFVLLAGPLFSVSGSGSEPLFAEPPDRSELERLGTFASDPASDAAADSPRAEATSAEAGVEATTTQISAEAASAGDETTAAPAAEDEEEEGVGANVTSFSGGDVFGLLWRLALVALVIWVSIYVLRKFVNRSSRTSSESGAVKVLETIGLASNRVVYLIEAGDRILVVGSTPNQMTLLAELDEPEVVSALRNDANQASPRVATLGEMMRNVGQGLGQRFSHVVGRKEGAAVTGGGEDLSAILQQLLKTQAGVEASAQRLAAQPPGDVAASGAGAETE
ncbi:MAG: flagellar biosynthetic protein FliO [Dehalococcoidia bacterium]